MPRRVRGKNIVSPKDQPTAPVREREPWTPWGRWAKRRRERIERRRREREEQRRQQRIAREQRRQRRRRVTTRGLVFIGLLALACAIGLVVLIVLGRPYPWEALADVTIVMSLAQTLEDRQARWESLAIDRYTIEVTYTAEETVCGPVVLEVRSGQVIGQPGRSADHWFPPEVCDSLLDHLTVDGAFEWIAEGIQGFQPGATYLRASFDPVFGIPASFEAGVYRADRHVPGCCWQAAWRNIHPNEP